MALQSSHPPCSRWEWHRRAVIHPARDGNGIAEQSSTLLEMGMASQSSHPPYLRWEWHHRAVVCPHWRRESRSHNSDIAEWSPTILLLHSVARIVSRSSNLVQTMSYHRYPPTRKIVSVASFHIQSRRSSYLVHLSKPAQKGDVMTYYTCSQL